jgi:3-oxoacyl-[acyl-carrier-protein] synthase-1
MAESALGECLAELPEVQLRDLPVLLVLAEQDRPGRLQGLDDTLLRDLLERCGGAFHPESQVIAKGRTGGIEAIEIASRLMSKSRVASCAIVGVDSFLNAATLRAYHERGRLLTGLNSDGFIPGEAAGAFLLESTASRNPGPLLVRGWGFAKEDAGIESELPLRGEGLANAIRESFSHGGTDYHAVDYRICDANGEQYPFQEAALAMARTLRLRKVSFDLWHAADCIGEVGAATVPCALSIAWHAAEKGYAPGPGVLMHVGNTSGERAALVLRHDPAGRRNP